MPLLECLKHLKVRSGKSTLINAFTALTHDHKWQDVVNTADQQESVTIFMDRIQRSYIPHFTFLDTEGLSANAWKNDKMLWQYVLGLQVQISKRYILIPKPKYLQPQLNINQQSQLNLNLQSLVNPNLQPPLNLNQQSSLNPNLQPQITQTYSHR